MNTTYCICPKCKQRDRRKLPGNCRTCVPPTALVPSASAKGKAAAPKSIRRVIQKTAGRRAPITTPGDAADAVRL